MEGSSVRWPRQHEPKCGCIYKYVHTHISGCCQNIIIWREKKPKNYFLPLQHLQPILCSTWGSRADKTARRAFKVPGNVFSVIEQGIVFVLTILCKGYVSSGKPRAMCMFWMLKSFIITLNAASFQPAAARHNAKPRSPSGNTTIQRDKNKHDQGSVTIPVLPQGVKEHHGEVICCR